MFRNGMTIAIGPKNEASTLKSLKLAKIKDFYKMMSFRSTLMGYLVSGDIFYGIFMQKIQKKFLAGPTFGECSLCQKKVVLIYFV